MNRVHFSILIFTIYLCNSLGFAKERFLFEKGTISVSVPKGWQTTKDLFGIPLTLLGPELAGGRPVVSFTSTGIKDLKFDQEKLEKKKSEYVSGRENWLKQKEGKSLRYFAYEVEHRNDGIEVHKIGYEYELNAIIFSEHSYYILCEGQLFHGKVLLRKDHIKKYQNLTNEIVRSFSCK